MSDVVDLVPAEAAQLVQTPRTLDKTWTRLLRGDRGCAYDAMSLIGVGCAIITASLARMELWPWFPFYLSVGILGLGYVLGTRAQRRSGKQRRRALTEGPLVALGIVDAEASLLEASGSRAKVGRALVVLRKTNADDLALSRDPVAAQSMAQKVKEGLDTDQFKSPELDALVEDRFSFARLTLPGSEYQDWFLTRAILQTDRLASDAGPLECGAVVWAIFHEETDILEQALLG